MYTKISLLSNHTRKKQIDTKAWKIILYHQHCIWVSFVYKIEKDNWNCLNKEK